MSAREHRQEHFDDDTDDGGARERCARAAMG